MTALWIGVVFSQPRTATPSSSDGSRPSVLKLTGRGIVNGLRTVGRLRAMRRLHRAAVRGLAGSAAAARRRRACVDEVGWIVLYGDSKLFQRARKVMMPRTGS